MTFKITCTKCGWVGYRQSDDLKGRKCPECREATLVQERHQHTATHTGPRR